MQPHLDPLGTLLLRNGVLTEEVLGEMLDLQQRQLPLGSLCYILGQLDEETIAQALSRQCGVPSVVLDRSVIRLDALDGISRENALRRKVLPVFQDDKRLFIAAEDPDAADAVARELRFIRRKAVVVHVALHITLARTIRACYQARAQGARFYAGPLANSRTAGEHGFMVVVSDAEPTGEQARIPAMGGYEVDDVTSNLGSLEVLMNQEEETGVEPWPIEHLDADTPVPGWNEGTPTARASTGPSSPDTLTQTRRLIDLDADADADADARRSIEASTDHSGNGRALIVDDDFATRHLLVKLLQPAGIVTATSTTGSDAVHQLKACPPDVVIIDVMLPEIDGFQICRAIKQSRSYRHIAVILMSAMLSSARVTDEILHHYGADGYFEKPLDTDRLLLRIKEILRTSQPGKAASDDDSFKRALALYKGGDIDSAIRLLRVGLEVDPLSAKHHFVLANLLQKKSLFYEAIEAYETTINIKPEYFPALTRLAYLYYKKGFSAKAVEIWRRALPYCDDGALRQNIEAFIHQLITDVHIQDDY